MVLLMAFSSCTIEKRRYNRGWHIEFLGNSSKVNKKAKSSFPRGGHFVNPHKMKTKDSTIFRYDQSIPNVVRVKDVYQKKLLPESTKTNLVDLGNTFISAQKHLALEKDGSVKTGYIARLKALKRR